MFLKSLELNGFKSFAGKTVLEFPVGITAIVGPNGSGKSNIIDCIKWLLGERDAKNLRGSKTEDLIWNGTPKRPRLSLAQAGLNFDNGSGFFPVDFKEISISRRVGRDGISEYYLNKAEVRLKDIVDFFSKSRLGTKGLTIIGQGSSDLFVRVSPEERRVMIEEILGLREYQIKKSEAERKLKNTLFNLEKVKAMIGEVAPRLRLLKRQTSKWSKRVSLEEELNNLENNYFSFKLGEIESAELKLKPTLSSFEKAISEKQKELAILESEIKRIEREPKEYKDIKRIKEEEATLFKERSETEKELGRLEAKLEFLGGAGDEVRNFKAEELLVLISEVKSNLELDLRKSSFDDLKKAIEGLVKKIDDFLAPSKVKSSKLSESKELEKSRDSLLLRFENIESQLKALEEIEAEITKNLEGFNKQFQKTFELVEAKRGELRGIEEQRSKILFEKEKLNLKRSELENQLSQIGRRTSDFDSKKGSLIGESDLLGIEKRMFKLRTELASIGEIDEALIKEAAEVESHYNFLENQSKDLEKAIADLKEIIKDLGEKIHYEFSTSVKLINEEFSKFFRLMFGGGSAKLRIKKYELRIKDNNDTGNPDSGVEEKNKREDVGEESEVKSGVEIDLNLPKKRITSLEMLSGGEKSLVSIAALFALISVSPPPFLVLDEIDVALDESNSKRFATLIKEFSKKTQFVVATHNRATMEVADVLYGVAMGEDGASKILSLKLETS